MAPNDHILIVGAGVLGLTTAIQLSLAGHKVTLLARDLPGDFTIDYASPWAGAHFRPSPARTGPEQLEQQLMRTTYAQFEELATTRPECGVQFVPAIEYFDVADKETFLAKENGYVDWPDFEVLGEEEIPSEQRSGLGGERITLGVRYRSWILNSPVYLEWCRRWAVELGVEVIRAGVASLDEAVEVFRKERERTVNTKEAEDGGGGRSDVHVDVSVRAVVNATGRGFDDPDAFPSKGQFIIVSNPCAQTISHHWADGSSTVIVPRPLGGGTVIGGTKEPNNWSEDVSDEATETILKRVASLCPQMVEQSNSSTAKTHGFDIKQVYVARRPMRRGGLRLERETLRDGVPVVHCYGAGASGFKISWGVAKHVEALLEQVLDQSSASGHELLAQSVDSS
ncbi:Uncharacterized protein PECH_008081 [Penicillium ucsense]|uniref:FAD dependent oxidoreductase domain-containing protein n=1 Tax=Penicillium ucsense TaxID=2839758 RepID=A0A8J8WKG7_9EURO|nr:Uncharacterized protein PECM_003366 [Penicillium ucsense]KAF7738714.1 Uncharacterized protein PECH_008081 [Penicillium ucsense]